MSDLADSRASILAAIRTATKDTGPHANQSVAQLAGDYAAISRAYVRKGSLAAEAKIDLMIERLKEYGADVIETSPGELNLTVAAALAASGRHKLVAPQGLPKEWMPAGYDWKADNNLTIPQIEETEGVVTDCSCAIADSGTIVLHHGPTEGRRVISLLPDWHLCILKASQIVETLPEYFDRFATPPVLATTISGPSATADIEMTRIKGVHGPRFLSVILVRD